MRLMPSLQQEQVPHQQPSSSKEVVYGFGKSNGRG
jgi:hypothetical protein